MKILVGIKRVIDYTVPIRLKADGSGVETQNVKMGMNPFDAIALEEAISIQEKSSNSTDIIAVSIGSTETQETLRQALAMGADRALWIKSKYPLEPLHIAKILAKLAEKEKPDLILLGKQAIDDDCNQTGQMLAGLLNWPQGTFASAITLNFPEAIVTREVDGGLETLALQLPAVITADLRLNEPRYITLPNIMRAKQKPLDIIEVEAFKIDLKPRIEILALSEPPKRKPGVILDNIDALIKILT